MNPRHIHRSDANQQEIVSQLRRIGCKVEIIGGTVDLLVGVPWKKRIVLMEVKKDGKAKLKPSQEKFFAEWAGLPVYRVNSLDDALNVVGFP